MSDAIATAPAVLSEATIGLTAAAAMLGKGRGGRPVHPATLTRWILNGAPRPGGGRVKLEAVRVGSAWRTSREAVARFVAALTPSAEAPPPVRSLADRDRSAAEAEAELAAAGC